MRPTVVPVLMKHKKSSEGTCPIYIRITANRSSCYIHTKVCVSPKDWNSNKKSVRASDRYSQSKNNTIIHLCTEANLAAENHRTAEAVKAEVTKGYSGVFPFIEEYIDDLELKGKYWEKRKFEVTLRKLSKVFPRSLNWIQFSHRDLVKFESYLRNQCKNSDNTTHNEMKRLRRLFKLAHADRLISADDNPFIRYTMPRKTVPKRRRLSFQEISKLMELNLKSDFRLGLARDVFLFSYFGGGVRFSDLCVLTKKSIEDGRVTFTSMKTGQAVANLLPEQVNPFVAGYHGIVGELLFPLIDQSVIADPIALRRQISSKNVMVNSRLKKVAKRAGIDPTGLTMHVARHSVANEAQAQGHEIRAIQSMLGHKKVTTTTGYVDELNQRRNDKLMSSLWNVAS